MGQLFGRKKPLPDQLPGRVRVFGLQPVRHEHPGPLSNK
jgi:hypothetical protein